MVRRKPKMWAAVIFADRVLDLILFLSFLLPTLFFVMPE
jgi:hypothetical protein